jgi:hypothetical protein
MREAIKTALAILAARPASRTARSSGTDMYLHPACTFQLSANSVTGEPSAATVVLLISTVAPADLAFVQMFAIAARRSIARFGDD